MVSANFVPSLVRALHSNGVGEKKKQWKLGPVFEGFAIRIAVRKTKDGRTSADLLGSSCVRVLAQAGSADARTIQAEGQIPHGCKQTAHRDLLRLCFWFSAFFYTLHGWGNL